MSVRPPREPLRIGVLGAARISELSVVEPARATGHRIVAVAARDRSRAEDFARRHGVERVLDSYAELVADPEVEVVYNPLANALHGPWNRAALEAGKHILTEKPSASNAEEASTVRDAVAEAGTVFMEGFHYLFHPVTQRLHSLLDSGELGELRAAEAMVAMPAPPAEDPRWSPSLAGGALMDLGCYGLHALHTLAPWAGGAPRLKASRGAPRWDSPEVDAWLDADVEFPGGARGAARCDMAHPEWRMSLRLVGTRGEATAHNFVQPHLDDRLLVRTPAGERTERLGIRSSYTYQWESFAAHLRCGTPLPVPLPLDADDAHATMRLIDDCYRAAGFTPRGTVRC